MKDCWKVLGIEPTSDIGAIRNARRALIKVWHPDRAQSVMKKQLCDLRCADINAAFDEAVERARILDQNQIGARDGWTNISTLEKTSGAQTLFSSPITWLAVSILLLLIPRMPLPARAVSTTLVIIIASFVAVIISSNMMRTCAPNQKANWLLLALASAVVLLVSLYNGSAKTLGPMAAQIVFAGGVVALPVWILGYLFRET
jgi:hypothetical protein